MINWFKQLGARVLAELLAPGVACWSRRQERKILPEGRTLTAQELAFAQGLGIAEAEQLRVLAVGRIPLPLPQFFLRWAERRQFGCPNPVGMTVGHGIYAVVSYSAEFMLISHELVHVLQYQRCGGHWQFMRKYLAQCLCYGYDQAPMEIEARQHSE